MFYLLKDGLTLLFAFSVERFGEAVGRAKDAGVLSGLPVDFLFHF